eukprot:SAG31_NODE_512_length_14721_cov_17.995623_4_plen_63_part_00
MPLYYGIYLWGHRWGRPSPESIGCQSGGGAESRSRGNLGGSGARGGICIFKINPPPKISPKK